MRFDSPSNYGPAHYQRPPVDPAARRGGQRLHLNVRDDGTTYVDHNPEQHTLTPYCQQCPAWAGGTVTYVPDGSTLNLRAALLRTNTDTVWHAIEHGSPIPRTA